MLNGKGLAGYVITASGEKIAFAAYVNHVSLSPDPEAAQSVAGQALGEIAAAAYDATFEAPSDPEQYELIIRNGHIIDGAGNPWYAADLAIKGDRIAAIGDLKAAHAKREIDASGRIVSPGFIDMLGQSELSLLIDNRSISKLAQGITTEITGEGGSIAPQNEKTIASLKPMLDHYKLTLDWTTLDQYVRRLEKQGTPLNIGTYVGSAQIREAVIGDDDRAPTAAELAQMQALVEQAMKDGAMGISSALIYPPNIYAKTDELIALAKVASKYGGIYATHMQRRRLRNRRARRSHSHRPRSESARRDLPPQGERQTSLGQYEKCSRNNSSRPRFRLGHRGRYVPVRRRSYRARFRPATLGCGRRPAKTSRPPQTAGNSRTHQEGSRRRSS